MKTKELLKILDMTEEKQLQWLHVHGLLNKGECHESIENKNLRHKHLADLAFRLRNENIFEFTDGLEIIHKHLFPKLSNKTRETNYAGWFLQAGKPIHFIIAALIAKEKE